MLIHFCFSGEKHLKATVKTAAFEIVMEKAVGPLHLIHLCRITKLTIKTEEKNIQSKHYLQVLSFNKLLFISILKISFQLKKLISIKNEIKILERS